MALRLALCVAVLAFVSVEAWDRPGPVCDIHCPYGRAPGHACRCRPHPVETVTSPCEFKRCPIDTICQVQNHEAVCVGTGPVIPVHTGHGGRRGPVCAIDCPYGREPGHACRCRQYPVTSPCEIKSCPFDTICQVQNHEAVCVGTGPVIPVHTGDVCHLPKTCGSCSKHINRYYYNIRTGRCEPFIYNGCRGNGNNFLTLRHCRLRCERPTNHY